MLGGSNYVYYSQKYYRNYILLELYDHMSDST